VEVVALGLFLWWVLVLGQVKAVEWQLRKFFELMVDHSYYKPTDNYHPSNAYFSDILPWWPKIYTTHVGHNTRLDDNGNF